MTSLDVGLQFYQIFKVQYSLTSFKSSNFNNLRVIWDLSSAIIFGPNFDILDKYPKSIFRRFAINLGSNHPGLSSHYGWAPRSGIYKFWSGFVLSGPRSIKYHRVNPPRNFNPKNRDHLEDFIGYETKRDFLAIHFWEWKLLWHNTRCV